MHVLAVPALGALVGGDAAQGPAVSVADGARWCVVGSGSVEGAHRSELDVPSRVEEQWHGDAICRWCNHAVRSGDESPAADPFEHVAQVADERIGHGRDVDPPALGRVGPAGEHLQSAGVVLCEQREQPVVGVLADSPPRRCPGRLICLDGRAGLFGLFGRCDRGVVEDPEQDRRIGAPLVERGVVAADAERDAAQHRSAYGGDRIDPSGHQSGERSGSVGVEVGTVQGDAGRDPIVVGREFDAEVQALLAVGRPGGELVAEREPAAPRRAAVDHGDVALLGGVEREELAGRAFQLRPQVDVDAMADDLEETGVFAGRHDPHPDGSSGVGVGARHEVGHVDGRDGGHGPRCHRVVTAAICSPKSSAPRLASSVSYAW